jgi:hypothetical protein
MLHSGVGGSMRKDVAGIILAILTVASLGAGYLAGKSTRATETLTSTSTSISTFTLTLPVERESSIFVVLGRVLAQHRWHDYPFRFLGMGKPTF